MSDENDIVNKIQELIIEKIKEALPVVRDKQYFFTDVATEARDGVVFLKSGKIAAILNNGSFNPGDSVLIIKTSDDSLYAYYPPFGGIARSVIAAVIAGKGYFSGGWSNISNVLYFNTIDGIDFESETGFTLSITLSVARHGLAGVSSNEKGYFKGGFGWSFVPTKLIDGVIFSNDTAFVFSTNLDSFDFYITGIKADNWGYFTTSDDRSVPALLTFAVNKLVFSNEALSIIQDTLTHQSSMAGINSSYNGYIGGGVTTGRCPYWQTCPMYVGIDPTDQPRLFNNCIGASSVTNLITRIAFSNDTAQIISAILNMSRNGLMGLSAAKKGYFVGGQQPYSSFIEALVYSSDTVSIISETLITGLGLAAGVESTLNGYLGGGEFSYGYMASNFQRLNFTDETVASIESSISQGRSSLAGVSNNG